jgi:hypothetical protein
MKFPPARPNDLRNAKLQWPGFFNMSPIPPRRLLHAMRAGLPSKKAETEIQGNVRS